MLSIRIGTVLYSITSEQVQLVDYIDAITVLPFIQTPIEGLTLFNGRPLVQIDAANALGIEQSTQGIKRLIVKTQQGMFALRIHEVLTLQKQKTSSGTQKNSAVPSPVLQLFELLPWSLKIKKSDTTSGRWHSDLANTTEKKQKLTVLLVASANKTIALLMNSIDHIQEMSSLQTLEGQSLEGDLLIRVKDHLLPSHSLGQLLRLSPALSEEIAIIVRGEHNSWALLVEKVLDIEELEQVYSSGIDGRGLWYVTQDGQIQELIDANQLIETSGVAPRLWYVTKTGKIQELIDANQLLGMPHEALTINIIEPQKTTKALHVTERLMTDGLRIGCATGLYLLPLSMAKRTMKYLDTSSMTKARFPNGQRDNRSGRIPWINATALLFGQHSEIKDSSTIALTLDNDEQILLNVEAVSLSQSVSAHEKWQPVDLPYPLTLFFDAACYDNETQRWILRVVEHIKFRNLPWSIKKSIAKAILGWFDRRR